MNGILSDLCRGDLHIFFFEGRADPFPLDLCAFAKWKSKVANFVRMGQNVLQSVRCHNSFYFE